MDDFGTAQVLGQSARAAGAPRSEGGERGDLWHARINSRSGGGAAGPEPEPAQQQQPRVEVTVRLDVRLPGLPGKALQVPNLHNSFAYNVFHVHKDFQGVSRQAGRGAYQRGGPLHQASLRPLPEAAVSPPLQGGQ